MMKPAGVDFAGILFRSHVRRECGQGHGRAQLLQSGRRLLQRLDMVLAICETSRTWVRRVLGAVSLRRKEYLCFVLTLKDFEWIILSLSR